MLDGTADGEFLFDETTSVLALEYERIAFGHGFDLLEEFIFVCGGHPFPEIVRLDEVFEVGVFIRGGQDRFGVLHVGKNPRGIVGDGEAWIQDDESHIAFLGDLFVLVTGEIVDEECVCNLVVFDGGFKDMTIGSPSHKEKEDVRIVFETKDGFLQELNVLGTSHVSTEEKDTGVGGDV